ncbi:RNA-binding S4 domain protein [gamma proteobacterium HTCC5015]|nr:RNA-binding S4 domain protein [gamma proteobacterium HTCC5015]
MSADKSLQTLRLDKWLWAARFYKTRSLATAAISGGHVHLNSERIKPAKTLKCGDEVRIRKGQMEITIVVEAISDRRGPAAVAQTLYRETAESQIKREQDKSQIRAERAALPTTRGRPDKHTQRELRRLKKEQGE